MSINIFSFNKQMGCLLMMVVLLGLPLSACDDETMFTPVLYTDLSEGILNVPIEGMEKNVKVVTNVKDWQIQPVDKANDWCSYSIGENQGVAFVKFMVSPNAAEQPRETKFVIAANGCKSQVITITQLGLTPTILLDVASKKIAKEGEEFVLTVTSNIAYTYQRQSDSGDWLSVTEQQAPDARPSSIKSYLIKVEKNRLFTERTENLIFSTTEESALEPVVLSLTQEKEEMAIEESKDVKLEVASAELLYGNTYGKQVASLTIDGDYFTNYSGSPVTAVGDSVVILYTLKQTQKIDYIKLTQRANKDKNSIFSKGTIWLQEQGKNDWMLKEKFVVTPGDDATSDVLATNIAKVRLCLYRSEIGRNAALAEFECFQRSSSTQEILDCAKYFTDGTYSQLQPGVTAESIKEIKNPVMFNLASELLKGTYDSEFRIRAYHSCKSPLVVAKEITVGNRSQYDNPTGVYFEQDLPVFVFVGKKGKSDLTLSIADFREDGQKSTIGLKEGLNVIRPNHSGNGYIQYWTSDETADTPVKIHICYGSEIGFWDKRQGHNNQDWSRIVRRAQENVATYQITNAMMDVLGDRVQLMNTVNSFVTFALTDIASIVDKQDEMLYHEYVMMGLEKHNMIPKNRFLGVRSWGGSPNWNGVCANYPNAENTMLVPTVFLNNIWVFAHEFGHGNQVAQMKGAGWAEVTNNLYGSYAQYQMCDRNNLRLEHEEYKRSGSNSKVRGDRFNAYLKEAFVNKTLYLQHEGEIKEDGSHEADPFVSLVPLWQLTLYYMIAGEGTEWHKPDFWPDVHWDAIQDNKASYSWGQKYVNFMKRAINASGMNLCKFFTNMGLLRESDRMISDYGGPKQVKITASMVQEVINYGQGKPEPSSPVMGYISANSIDIFKNKRQVQGTFNAGVTKATESLTVAHDVWKNVIAFETYKGNDLIDVCISGTGSVSNTSTFVRYPQGATRVEAVGWDGTRLLVYGSK